MVRNLRKYISVMLLVVYAAFFASAHFCYHVHQLADGQVVHSHFLWGDKAHSHSSMQLQLIDQLNTTSYQHAEVACIESILPRYSEALIIVPAAVYLSLEGILSFSLRAPPVL